MDSPANSTPWWHTPSQSMNSGFLSTMGPMKQPRSTGELTTHRANWPKGDNRQEGTGWNPLSLPSSDGLFQVIISLYNLSRNILHGQVDVPVKRLAVSLHTSLWRSDQQTFLELFPIFSCFSFPFIPSPLGLCIPHKALALSPFFRSQFLNT